MAKLRNRMARTGLVVAGLLTALVGAYAWAGYKVATSVIVSTADKEAWGSLGTARNSADAIQYIGCTTTSGNGTFESGSCYARDAAGTTISCITTNVTQVHTMGHLGTASFLRFDWDATGHCTGINVRNTSYYAPMNHN